MNLSDLAAMASRPLAGVVALALPRRGGMDLAVALYEGMLPLAEQYGVAIAGGDTNSWDGPLAISVTLLGAVTRPWTAAARRCPARRPDRGDRRRSAAASSAGTSTSSPAWTRPCC